MNISTILLILFLLLAGLIFGFGVSFDYDKLILGVLGVGAAIFMALRK